MLSTTPVLDMSIDYCVTESDYHARSVAKWLGYHRVVTGRPHHAQTQAKRPLTHEYHQVRSPIGRTRRLSRAPRVTDIVARGAR